MLIAVPLVIWIGKDNFDACSRSTKGLGYCRGRINDSGLVNSGPGRGAGRRCVAAWIHGDEHQRQRRDIEIITPFAIGESTLQETRKQNIYMLKGSFPSTPAIPLFARPCKRIDMQEAVTIPLFFLFFSF